MNKSNKNTIKDFYVITPFKGPKSRELIKTIESLYSNKFFYITHIVIFDKRSERIINKLKKESNFNNNSFYRLIFEKEKKKGIYNAINQGLVLIPRDSYYLVLGSGDKIINFKGALEESINKIIFLPYKLSTSKKEKYIKSFRSFYLGMPYCHNAIVYINDGSEYDISYKISADYAHFLNYIKRYSLTVKILQLNFQENLFIEYESLKGLSSKSFFTKNIENIVIVYKELGLSKFYLYFWHNFRRIIEKIAK